MEYKVIHQQQKKSVPWAKQTGLLSLKFLNLFYFKIFKETNDGKPLFEQDKGAKIIVYFQKDLLIRKNSSKSSHLDKIQACHLVLKK